MSELKAGDSIDFQVGDKTLTIEPIPYGRLKKILRIVLDFSKKAADGGDKRFVPDIVDQYLPEIFPLLFAEGKYPFLTLGWIDEHMTVPTIRKIIEAAVTVNGIRDFFGKAFGGTLTSPNGQPIPTIPTENSGSITSSGSDTAGDPKT